MLFIVFINIIDILTPDDIVVATDCRKQRVELVVVEDDGF